MISKFKGTLEECSEACKGLRGCTGFNFQADACFSSSTWSVGPQACVLYSGECHGAPNECLDYYSIGAGTPSAKLPWDREVAVGKGCKNWASIRDGSGTTREDSRDACGYRCFLSETCVGFGFQEAACPTPNGSGFPGACALWDAACERDDNSCWDDHEVDNATRSLSGNQTLLYRFPDLWWALDEGGGLLKVYPYWIDPLTAPGETACPSEWPTSGSIDPPIPSEVDPGSPLAEFLVAPCAEGVLPAGASVEGKDPVPSAGNVAGDEACYHKWYFVNVPDLLHEAYCSVRWGSLGLPTHCARCLHL